MCLTYYLRWSFRGNKTVPLKDIADQALAQCKSVKKCIVFQRTFQEINWDQKKDIWWHDFIEGLAETCTPTVMDAEDPLFILYTSGSTGKPKEWCTAVEVIWFIPPILL